MRNARFRERHVFFGRTGIYLQTEEFGRQLGNECGRTQKRIVAYRRPEILDAGHLGNERRVPEQNAPVLEYRSSPASLSAPDDFVAPDEEIPLVSSQEA